MIKKIVIYTFLSLLIILATVSCNKEELSTSNDLNHEESFTQTDFIFTNNIFYLEPIELVLRSQAEFNNFSYKMGDVPSIAYMPPGLEFDYYVAIGQGIQSYANEIGATMFTLAPEKGDDITGQMKMLEDVIDQEVNIIILSTHDEVTLAPIVEHAVNKGIEIIIVNSDINNFPTPIHAVVGYKQRNGTMVMGEYVSDLVGNEDFKVGIIEGQPGWHSTERVGGFLDVINTKSNFSILASLNGKWNVEGGRIAALEMLQSYPDIQLIFAANDYEIIGAKLAAESLALENILLFGNDGDTQCLEEIAVGNIVATINTDPYQMGKIALQVALDGLSNKFQGGYVETPTVIVDKDNVLDFLQNPESLYPKPLKDY